MGVVVFSIFYRFGQFMTDGTEMDRKWYGPKIKKKEHHPQKSAVSRKFYYKSK